MGRMATDWEAIRLFTEHNLDADALMSSIHSFDQQCGCGDALLARAKRMAGTGWSTESAPR